eukprot:scaffold125513_cov44-Prasinocladus_malaysianus.AAC.1
MEILRLAKPSSCPWQMQASANLHALDKKAYGSQSISFLNSGPRLRSRVNIIDFTVTRLGLEEQLLALVVRKERPDLEEQKDRLVLSISNDKRQLKVRRSTTRWQ